MGVRKIRRVAASSASPTDARYWETRVARNGRGGRLDPIANTLKAEAGQTGIGDAAPMVLFQAPDDQRTYSITPESGQGADLRAVEVDKSNALTVTELTRSTDRGLRVVTAAQALDGKDVRLAGQTGALTASMNSARTANQRVGMVAYEVDKERGIPNSESVKVREIQVAGTITADGDPAEKNDRGTRVLQGRVGKVRRLTPTECERLQSFPDGWTLL